MGKYINYKVAGYWMYYTSHCLNEGIIHVHASNNGKLTEIGSAKIWVHADGTSTVERTGCLKANDIALIQKWIYNNVDLIQAEWLSNNQGGEFKEN